MSSRYFFKLKGSHHVAGIGECNCGLLQGSRFGDKGAHLSGRLQDRILGMVVQVRKHDIFLCELHAGLRSCGRLCGALGRTEFFAFCFEVDVLQANFLNWRRVERSKRFKIAGLL